MMSMRIYIFLLTVCFTFQMRAQQVPDWENPRVVGINKEEEVLLVSRSAK